MKFLVFINLDIPSKSIIKSPKEVSDKILYAIEQQCPHWELDVSVKRNDVEDGKANA